MPGCEEVDISGHPQPVAHLVHRLDGAGAELAAQALDMDVHGAGDSLALVAPGRAQHPGILPEGGRD